MKLDKKVWIVIVLIGFIILSNQSGKKEAVMSMSSNPLTGQVIGGSNLYIEHDGMTEGIIMLQLPQGIRSNTLGQLESFIHATGIEEECGVDYDFMKLNSITSCTDFENKFTELLQKVNIVQECNTNSDYYTDVHYSIINYNGQQIKKIKITEIDDNGNIGNNIDTTVDVYGFCKNNIIYGSMNLNHIKGMIDYYSSSNLPSTLNGYIPYLMENYNNIDGNTGADVCKTKADCSDGDKCSNYFCVPATAAPYCGDNSCNNGETCSTCSTDCGCASGKTCSNNACISESTGTTTTTSSGKEWYENTGTLVMIGIGLAMLMLLKG
jgi:hypothetical protein